MSFLLRMQDSTLTSLSNLVCPNVHCQRVFFRIRTQMARHVKAFRVDDWDIGWRIYIYIYRLISRTWFLSSFRLACKATWAVCCTSVASLGMLKIYCGVCSATWQQLRVNMFQISPYQASFAWVLLWPVECTKIFKNVWLMCTNFLLMEYEIFKIDINVFQYISISKSVGLGFNHRHFTLVWRTRGERQEMEPQHLDTFAASCALAAVLKDAGNIEAPGRTWSGDLEIWEVFCSFRSD